MPAGAALTLSLGDVSAQGWQATDVVAQVTSDETGAYQLQLSLAGLALPFGQWKGLQLDCAELNLTREGYDCPAFTLSAQDAEGPQQLQGSFRYTDTAHWALTLENVALAGGRWQIKASAAQTWRAELTARGVRIDKVLAMFPQWDVPPWQWRGRLDVTASLQGVGDQPSQVSLAARVRDLNWSSPDGLQAGQSLSGDLNLKAQARGAGWQGQLTSAWAKGQVYADPVYLTFDKHPIRLASRGGWQPRVGQLQFDDISIDLGRLVSIKGGLTLPLGKPKAFDGQLDIQVADLGAVYPVLLQPWFYGGALGSLQIVGQVEASAAFAEGVPQAAELVLKQVHLDDEAGRFGLSGLAGQLFWTAQAAPADSVLRWQSGHVYAVDFGRALASMQLQGNQLTLREPLVLPMLDGVLRMPRLKAAGIGTEAPTWTASLQAKALSLPRLTQTLGWPALSGELSVQIPDVHYADSVIALDGELLAEAFDGSVRVSELRLQGPLSPAPVFQASADLKGLDLERVTKVFDFGMITGRLDGQVRGLELVGWEPVAFQAVLQSPLDDDRPHRISQRAVENLTALGNSGAVALSGTFLRFFESFRYDRLMFQVDLAGQRATLDGIPHPEGGYYLVKGAGLPRIDVIGRNRDVAWRDLIKRLRQISLKGAQVR